MDGVPPPPSQQFITNLKIGGKTVYFPNPRPFPPQLALMSAVLKALDTRANALLESPTGTGKTIALLCSSLAYQADQRSKVGAMGAAMRARAIVRGLGPRQEAPAPTCDDDCVMGEGEDSEGESEAVTAAIGAVLAGGSGSSSSGGVSAAHSLWNAMKRDPGAAGSNARGAGGSSALKPDPGVADANAGAINSGVGASFMKPDPGRQATGPPSVSIKAQPSRKLGGGGGTVNSSSAAAAASMKPDPGRSEVECITLDHDDDDGRSGAAGAPSATETIVIDDDDDDDAAEAPISSRPVHSYGAVPAVIEAQPFYATAAPAASVAATTGEPPSGKSLYGGLTANGAGVKPGAFTASARTGITARAPLSHGAAAAYGAGSSASSDGARPSSYVYATTGGAPPDTQGAAYGACGVCRCHCRYRFRCSSCLIFLNIIICRCHFTC